MVRVDHIGRAHQRYRRGAQNVRGGTRIYAEGLHRNARSACRL